MKIKTILMVSVLLLSIQTRLDIIDEFVKDIDADYPNAKAIFTKEFGTELLSECDFYDIDPWLVISLMETESRFDPQAENHDKTCIGLGQLSVKWHSDRMKSLIGEDASFYEPMDNLITAIDYLHELDIYYENNLTAYQNNDEEHWKTVLMSYNGGPDYAKNNLKKGKFSSYSETIIKRCHELREYYGSLFYTEYPDLINNNEIYPK